MFEPFKAAKHCRERRSFDLHANPLRDLVANLCVWGIVLALAASIGIVIYGSFITFWPYVPELTLEIFFSAPQPMAFARGLIV